MSNLSISVLLKSICLVVPGGTVHPMPASLWQREGGKGRGRGRVEEEGKGRENEVKRSYLKVATGLTHQMYSQLSSDERSSGFSCNTTHIHV